VVQKKTVKIQMTLPLSSYVVEHFRATGKCWQSRIDFANPLYYNLIAHNKGEKSDENA